MSREKEDNCDMEMTVHGDEIDDVELDPEKERSFDPVRTRRENMKEREEVEAEEMYRARRSLGGYLARVSTVINQVKTSIAEVRECEEVREAVKNLEHAWARYSDMYHVISLRTCLLKNLSVLNSVTVRFMTITLDV